MQIMNGVMFKQLLKQKYPDIDCHIVDIPPIGPTPSRTLSVILTKQCSNGERVMITLSFTENFLETAPVEMFEYEVETGIRKLREFCHKKSLITNNPTSRFFK